MVSGESWGAYAVREGDRLRIGSAKAQRLGSTLRRTSSGAEKSEISQSAIRNSGSEVHDSLHHDHIGVASAEYRIEDEL